MYKLDDVISFVVKMGELDKGHSLVEVTPWNIQNLLFYIQSTHYLDMDEKLFDEPMYACRYGYTLFRPGEQARFVMVSNSLRTNIIPSDSMRILTTLKTFKGFTNKQLIDTIKNQPPWWQAITSETGEVDFKEAAKFFREGDSYNLGGIFDE